MGPGPLRLFEGDLTDNQWELLGVALGVGALVLGAAWAVDFFRRRR